VARGEDILAHAAAWQPHVVVMDLLMPGGLDGIETTRRAGEGAPRDPRGGADGFSG